MTLIMWIWLMLIFSRQNVLVKNQAYSKNALSTCICIQCSQALTFAFILVYVWPKGVRHVPFFCRLALKELVWIIT